jgi:hypothetical protein
MKNNMVIQYDNGTKTQYVCPACKIDYLGGNIQRDKVIPTFYSAKHAYDEGWRKTTHHRFSQNGQPVWVCPDCWPGDAS